MGCHSDLGLECHNVLSVVVGLGHPDKRFHSMDKQTSNSEKRGMGANQMAERPLSRMDIGINSSKDG